MKINKLPIKRLVYEINAPVKLPLHGFIPTVTFRGAFGHSLLQLLAREQSISSVEDKAKIYQQLMHPEGLETKSHNATPPRPFVMRGYHTRPDLKSFILEVLLFGKVGESSELIDNVIVNMAEMGLGHQNIVCKALKIHSEEVDLVVPSLDQGAIALNMQTPTRIKHNGKYLRDGFSFERLIKGLHFRLAELVRTYTDFELGDLSEAFIQKAQQIGSMDLESIEYIETKRTSTRTKQECSLSGMIGKQLYMGDLKPFEELLAYLPWIHIGSSAAFGCGWCTLEFNTFN